MFRRRRTGGMNLVSQSRFKVEPLVKTVNKTVSKMQTNEQELPTSVPTGTICFITAIYGNYEATCKKFAKQSVPADFICFTDNPGIMANGWTIDTTPYHLLNPSPLDNGSYHNSLCKNQNTFNVAKYYKQAFHNIPALSGYDAVVWIDGTIEVIDETAAEYILRNIRQAKVIGWHHEWRGGKMFEEVYASDQIRYTSTLYNGQEQPYQDIFRQYVHYLMEGYRETYFDEMKEKTGDPHYGMWITCFVAFANQDPTVHAFLDLWYLQTLRFTTQDQISFPFVCQQKGLLPLTLPNAEVKGFWAHSETQFYIKHGHGK